MAVQVLAGYWDLDLENRELLLCPRSRRMFGLGESSSRKLAKYDWQPRIHPDDLPAIDGELATAGRNKDVYSARFRTLRPDGSIGHVLGVGRATARNPNRFVGLNFDLHDMAAAAERESRSVRSMMSLASAFMLGSGPANENDFRPWRAWPPTWALASGSRLIGKSSQRLALLRRARATIERRQLRKRFLNPDMLGEPAFDILLALYVPAAGGIMPLQILSTLVDVSPAIALRWLRFLANEGLVLIAQEAGAGDTDATTAALTDKGRIALDEYFRAAGPLI
jgi:PAS domain-containing protein